MDEGNERVMSVKLIVAVFTIPPSIPPLNEEVNENVCFAFKVGD
jgi:hypothetical protein